MWIVTLIDGYSIEQQIIVLFHFVSIQFHWGLI